MRPISFRAISAGVLALLVVACSDTATDPMAPGSARRSIVPGVPDLVITELMADPSKVADASGEWFEIYNPGPQSVNLKGFKLVSGSGATGSETHTIATDVIADSGDYVVFGNNGNTATNGGVPVNYAYPPSGAGSLTLSNSSATEWLAIRTAGNITLDSVAYVVKTVPAQPAFGFPTGASRAVIDLAADNTIISGSNWATAVSTYGLGDRGTPGQPNQGGAPASVSVRISWVTPGTSFRVTATAVDSAGKPAPTNFTWSSSNTGIATVDPVTGNATGVSLGVATLTATASNGVSGSAP